MLVARSLSFRSDAGRRTSKHAGGGAACDDRCGAAPCGPSMLLARVGVAVHPHVQEMSHRNCLGQPTISRGHRITARQRSHLASQFLLLRCPRRLFRLPAYHQDLVCVLECLERLCVVLEFAVQKSDVVQVGCYFLVEFSEHAPLNRHSRLVVLH
eukprot:1134728-Rhodomonas_salina.2